jgi:hypothetical protein
LKKHLKRCTGKSNMSSGKYKISEILKTLKIDYTYNGSYNLLKSFNNGYLRFDFIIYLNNKIFMIEYDGRQHFEAIDYFGGHENFLIQQRNDEIKNNYCLDNKIPILRIPYTKFDDINITLICHFLLENSI